MSHSPLPQPRTAVTDRALQPATGAPGQATGPGPPPSDVPLGTFPRRIAGVTPDGRRWELLVNARSVSALVGGATVAEAHVWHNTDLLTIELWVDGADLPDALSAALVEQAFAHPAVHHDADIVVCLPRRDGGLLPHVLAHVDGATTRAAGMSSLVEGRVCEPWPAPPVPRPRET